jgi:hypothetical protein
MLNQKQKFAQVQDLNQGLQRLPKLAYETIYSHLEKPLNNNP